MTEIAECVFLFDVDNTLLDNDRLQTDLSWHLTDCYGAEVHDRFWTVFEDLRSELGYADYLGALQRYRLEALHHPKVLRLANWLVDYRFDERVYPNAIAVVEAAQRFGITAILSDGDAVFQPLKIQKSGLWEVFRDNVLIYVHKELELSDVEAHFPAKRYILIDDKLRILDAVKRVWGDRVRTIFPRQGHYAADRESLTQFPPADMTIDHIGDLLNIDLGVLIQR